MSEPSRSRFANSGDAQRPCLLLVHGWLHSSRIWAPLARLLEPGISVRAVDLPGFGGRPPPPGNVPALAALSEFLLETVHSIASKERVAAVLGDSLGGVLLLGLLERLPATVRSVVIASCPIEGLPPFFRIPVWAGLVSRFLRALHAFPRPVATILVRCLSFATFHKIYRADESLVQSVLSADPRTAQRILGELIESRIEDLAPRAGTKVLVLRGSRDRIVSRGTSRRLAKTLCGGYVEVPDSGHTLMLENPRVLAKILLRVVS